MTAQDYHVDRAGTGFAETNARFATLVAELDWLSAHSAHLASIGLRELRRNVRSYTFTGDGVTFDISATASAIGVTLILEDTAPERDGAVKPVASGLPGSGGRLRVFGQAFDEVTYSRTLGRNRWVLRRFTPGSAGSAVA